MRVTIGIEVDPPATATSLTMSNYIYSFSIFYLVKNAFLCQMAPEMLELHHFVGFYVVKHREKTSKFGYVTSRNLGVQQN